MTDEQKLATVRAQLELVKAITAIDFVALANACEAESANVMARPVVTDDDKVSLTKLHVMGKHARILAVTAQRLIAVAQGRPDRDPSPALAGVPRAITEQDVPEDAWRDAPDQTYLRGWQDAMTAVDRALGDGPGLILVQ